MSHDDSLPQLGPFEYGIIKRKVRQIIGYAGFSYQDQKDLEQELITRLLKGLQSYDPRHGHRYAFATTVVERAVATLLRDRRAQKRDTRRVCSLNAMIPVDGDSLDWTQTIGEHEHHARCGRSPRSREELSRLSHDITNVIASMTPELQSLAERLKHESVAAIAREQRIPRTTLQDRVRRIRQRFEQAGLQQYL